MTSTLDQELADAKKNRDQLLTQINKIKEQVTNLVEGQGKDIGVAEGLARTQIETRDHEKSKQVVEEVVGQIKTKLMKAIDKTMELKRDYIDPSYAEVLSLEKDYNGMVAEEDQIEMLNVDMERWIKEKDDAAKEEQAKRAKIE